MRVLIERLEQAPNLKDELHHLSQVFGFTKAALSMQWLLERVAQPGEDFSPDQFDIDAMLLSDKLFEAFLSEPFDAPVETAMSAPAVVAEEPAELASHDQPELLPEPEVQTEPAELLPEVQPEFISDPEPQMEPEPPVAVAEEPAEVLPEIQPEIISEPEPQMEPAPPVDVVEEPTELLTENQPEIVPELEPETQPENLPEAEPQTEPVPPVLVAEEPTDLPAEVQPEMFSKPEPQTPPPPAVVESPALADILDQNLLLGFQRFTEIVSKIGTKTPSERKSVFAVLAMIARGSTEVARAHGKKEILEFFLSVLKFIRYVDSSGLAQDERVAEVMREVGERLSKALTERSNGAAMLESINQILQDPEALLKH